MRPMVELLPSRRRAAEFARALEGDPRPVDPALQRLLDTVSRLAAVPLVEPRAEFRDDLRTRLLEAAAVELRADATAGAADTSADTAGAGAADAEHTGGVVADDPLAARRRRRLVAVATGLVLMGGGTGVAAASEQALPGDMLYPVKRTLENAQVTLATGIDDEGRALLDRAATRLQEAEALSADGVSSVEVAEVEGALADFTADAAAGGARLLEAYAASGDPAEVRALREFTSTSHETLADLADTLPPRSQPELSTAGETVVALDDKAMRVCPECAPALPPLTLPTDPVSLPTLDADASPYVEGRQPLGVADLGKSDPRRRADDQRRRPRSDRPAADADADDGPAAPNQDTSPPALPDVDLGDGGGTTAPQDGAGADAPQHDGAGTVEQGPRLDVGDLLGDGDGTSDGAPSQRKTDGPDVDDVTEPLDPLLEDTEDTLRRTGDSLDDLL